MNLENSFIKKFFKNKNLFIIIFLIIISFSSLFFLNNHSLVAHDEAVYGTRAKLIINSKDWFSPFEIPHHKTIGGYWPTVLCLKIFGINEFSVRFPSFLFSVINIYFLFKITKEISNKKVAYLSSILIISTPLWFNFSHYGGIDMYLVCINLIGIYNLLKIEENKFYLINIFFSGLFLSLGFFIRSYMQLLPIISFLPFLIYKLINLGNKKIRFFAFGFVIGLIPLALNLFYYYQDFQLEGIITLFKFANDKALSGNLFNGFIFYPTNLILLTLPISIFLVNGILIARNEISLDKKLLVIGSPIISVIILSITSARHNHYLLTIVPWVCLLSAIGLNDFIERDRKISRKISSLFSYTASFLGLLFSIFSFLLLINFFKIESINSFSRIFIFITSIYYLNISSRLTKHIYNKKLFVRNLFSLMFLQIILQTYLFASGITGNPNREFKQFIANSKLEAKNEEIFLLDVKNNNKTKLLIEFYLEERKFPKYEENYSNVPKYLILSKTELSKKRISNKYQIKVFSEYKDLSFIRLKGLNKE